MILTNLTILIIGASHLAKPGYLITSLHDELQNQGAKVHSIGVCGVEPSEWLIASKRALWRGRKRIYQAA